MNQKGQALIVGIGIGLLMILGLLGAYFLGRQSIPNPQPQNPVITSSNSLRPTITQGQTTQLSTPVTASLCDTEKTNILNLVTTFEASQQKNDAEKVFTFFTPPQTTDDVRTYNTLIKDTYGFRLYNAGDTLFQLKSYIVKEQPAEYNNSSSCLVKVDESRSYYTRSPDLTGYLPEKIYNLNIVLVKINNNWKIDQYLDTSHQGKYSGWYGI